MTLMFFFYAFRDHRDLHSFPTRRSSDLSIHYMGHIKMVGATQPFLSGAISKTVNVPKEATIEEIEQDRKSTRLNSSHSQISYAVFCLKKKKKIIKNV